jgi:2,4-dienoyl-CoA reductase-like NADH-dependent reductase (Old Yellow Enzyme family)
MPSSTTPALFTPIKIGQHVLKHRVVLAPLTRFRSSPTGVPSDIVPQYYEQRATEGGLLITEATAISPYAGGYPGTPGVHSEEQIEEWKKTTAAVHKAGGVIFMQIWHLGRASFSFTQPNGETVVSASAIGIEGLSPLGAPHEVPRALTVDEIKTITGDYAQAAKNAIAAGFDGKSMILENDGGAQADSSFFSFFFLRCRNSFC